MWHMIIAWMSGIGSVGAAFQIARVISNRKTPINLINGILIPLPQDPGWIDDPKIGNTFNLGNVCVTYKRCITNHYEIKCNKEYHAFIQQVDPCTNSVYDICNDDRALKYFHLIKLHHMKYMIECPEIKQLEAIK